MNLSDRRTVPVWNGGRKTVSVSEHPGIHDGLEEDFFMVCCPVYTAESVAHGIPRDCERGQGAADAA